MRFALLVALAAIGVSAAAATANAAVTALSMDRFNQAKHACAIVDGAAKCWGLNIGGQLGNGSTNYSAHATQVYGLTSGVTAISAGNDHTCAVVSGAVKCWGQGEHSELGAGYGSSAYPVQVTGLESGGTAVSAAEMHSCAVAGGAAYCWGSQHHGELGKGVFDTGEGQPNQVDGLTSGVTAITVGKEHSCAIVSGAAMCWGSNSDGQLGRVGGNAASPVQVTGLTSNVTDIAAGEYTTCAVQSGAAMCWGRGLEGQLGTGSTSASPTPVQVSGLTSGVTKVGVGNVHACAVQSGGVKCWGDAHWYKTSPLGDGTAEQSSLTPVAIPGMTSGVTSLAPARGGNCAIAAGVASCWGIVKDLAPSEYKPNPIQISRAPASQISLGPNFYCWSASGAAYCGGNNDYGQLGGNSYDGMVSGLGSGVTKISAGSFHACAIVDAQATCWGSGSYGRLGDGVGPGGYPENSDYPVEVTGLIDGVTDISAGLAHTCAVQDGAAFCWGENNDGEVGIGELGWDGGIVEPRQVVGLGTGVTAISAGDYFSCAVVSGAAKCWGRNSDGQLGDGSTTSTNAPVQVSGLTSGVTAISAGHGYACAVQSGAVKCWGKATDGRVGPGFSGVQSSPVAVAGIATGATAVSTGANQTCAIVGGATKCWGGNFFGQLGDGNVLPTGSVVTVAGFGSGSEMVDAGDRTTCGVVNQALRCWGLTYRFQTILLTGFEPVPAKMEFAPVTSFTAGPPQWDNQTSASFSLASDTPGSTFDCEYPNGDTVSVSADFTVNNLAQGPNYMRCRATSPDGVTDPEPAVHTWTVNVVPPWINAWATLNSDHTASVTFYGAYSYPDWKCKLDDGAAVPCSAPFVTPVLAPGSHTVTVTVPDGYGNIGSEVVVITVPSPVVPPLPDGGSGGGSGSAGVGGAGGGSGSEGASVTKPTPPAWTAPARVATVKLRKSGLPVSFKSASAGELLGTLKVKKGSSFVKLGAGSVQFSANETATLKIRLSKLGKKFLKSRKKRFSAILSLSYYAGGQTTVLGDDKISITR